jgi:hypothetical protein
MNLGPILIIKNTFPMLAHVLLFSVIIKSENTKISFTFCNHIKNIKISLFTALVYFLHLLYFILFSIFIPKPCAGQPDGGIGA